jgi:exopolyphosphatase/guanosine-5'-triphosphate,3'-diphosphate pyrophosphatase
MRIAVIDLGTNTCRLFLANVRGGTAVEEVARETTVVRLGQGVDGAQRLHPDAITRTVECLRGYAPLIERFDPAQRLLIATSVLRDAEDGGAVLGQIRREFGLPTRVLSGTEEAVLSFRGGTLGLDARGDPVVLIDIGGGSTEFACGVPGATPYHVASVDIGAVRLTERYLAHDPPLAPELDALRTFVAAAIARDVPYSIRRSAVAAIGVAGTFTTLVAHKLELRRYSSELVHGHVLSVLDLETAEARFAGMTSAQRGRLPGIQPGREDVILAGTVIAREACRAFGLQGVRCSEADLLHGAALALAEGSMVPSAAL